MMRKKSTLSILVIFALSLTLNYSCKLPRAVEKSSKQKPVWVHGLQNDFIIVEGVGLNYEQAQNDALKKLKERIVSSVATNISSETNMQITEKILDNMSIYSQNTEVNTRISSDFFNTLKGISINKSKEFYWENKKYPSKKYMIHYHILYPFSQRELNELIKEWEATDRAFTEELNNLEKQIADADNIYDLLILSQKAAALKEIFTGTRQIKSSILENEAKQIISNLKFEVLKHERGHLMLRLFSSGRYFNLSPELVYSAECAVLNEKRLIQDNKTLEIFYDSDFCYSEKTAVFAIQQNYDGIAVNGTFEIPANENQIRLMVNEPLRFRRIGGFEKNIEWYVPVRVFTDIEFTISRIEIYVSKTPRFSLKQLIGTEEKESFVFTDINKKVDGKGDIMLNFIVPESKSGKLEKLLTFLINETSDFKADGKLFIVPAGETKEYVFDFDGLRIILNN